jgi:hypothetical protein
MREKLYPTPSVKSCALGGKVNIFSSGHDIAITLEFGTNKLRYLHQLKPSFAYNIDGYYALKII